MTDAPDLTVALPAYLEGPNLAELLPALCRTLDGLGVSYEVVVADTPTPMDDTPAVCAANGVRHVPRVGGTTYGHAVNTAIASSPTSSLKGRGAAVMIGSRRQAVFRRQSFTILFWRPRAAGRH